MQSFLLDVNVLIALVDDNHVHRDEVLDWHSRMQKHTMLTCPITENGVIRILTHSKYPGGPILPAEVMGALAQLKTIGTWKFIADDVSLCDTKIFRIDKLVRSSQITDTYLIGLAQFHGARLATQDRSINLSAIDATRSDLVFDV